MALTFFLINLALRVALGEFRPELYSPSGALIVIPAMFLLLSKELIHNFFSGGAGKPESGESLREFVRPYWEIVRDWFPFLVILMMYYSFWGDATHLLVPRDRDALLIAWDQKLFGFQASVALQKFVTPALTGWMSFAYFFHILNIPIVACFIYLRRPRRSFRELMCGVLVICFFGILGYVLVPAVGPLYTLRDKFTVPLSQPLAVFNRQVEFMDFARIRRDVFPSLHVGISFLVWMYAYRNSKKLFWLLSPFILSLWVSTVYLRYHYLVDILAGLVLAPLCFLLSNWLFSRVGEFSVSIPLPALWADRLAGLGYAVPGPQGAGKVKERP